MSEEWKKIKGFDGLYEVSNLGNIRRRGKQLSISKWGRYKQIRLFSKTEARTMYVHRLVAIAFIPNPENKPMVNHIDGDKMNNSVNNLEWCTKQENEIHAWEHGMKEKIRETSKKNLEIARKYIHTKIPVVQLTLDGCFVKEWDSASDVMKETGIDSSAITKCCKGKLHKTGGYIWRYTEQK